MARAELGYTNQEVAKLLDKPPPNAARMVTERAIVNLTSPNENELRRL